MKIQRNTGIIDIIKFLSAIVVIAIHTNPIIVTQSYVANVLYRIIVEFAVPSFFMATGYLLVLEENDMEALSKQTSTDYIQRKFKNVLKVYITWCLLYAPLTIYGRMHSGDGLLRSCFILIRNYLFVGKQFNSYHLWYLLAVIYAIGFILVLKKANVKQYVYWLVAIFMFSVHTIFNDDFCARIISLSEVGGVVRAYQLIFVNGGVLGGLLWIVIGHSFLKFYKLERLYRKFTYTIISILIVLGIWGMIMGERLRPICVVFYVAPIYYLLMHVDIKETNLLLSLRRCSSTMYFIHLWVISILTLVFSVKEGIQLFICSLGITLMLSVLIELLKTKFIFVKMIKK